MGRAADGGGDPGGEAAVAHRLHLGDRAGERRHERHVLQQLLGFVDREGIRVHGLKLARYRTGVKRGVRADVLILAFAVLGVAMELRVPGELVDEPVLLVELLAFATPLAAGALATFGTPRPWHAAIAAAGFGIAAARLEVWVLARHVLELSPRGKLLAIAAIGGAVASALAVLTWRKAPP